MCRSTQTLPCAEDRIHWPRSWLAFRPREVLLWRKRKARAQQRWRRELLVVPIDSVPHIRVSGSCVSPVHARQPGVSMLETDSMTDLVADHIRSISARKIVLTESHSAALTVVRRRTRTRLTNPVATSCGGGENRLRSSKPLDIVVPSLAATRIRCQLTMGQHGWDIIILSE